MKTNEPKPNGTSTFNVRGLLAIHRRSMFNVLLTLLAVLIAPGTGFGQPVITNQPQTQAVAPGTTATFSVGASGTAPLAYRWQRNPGTGFSDLANRTNAVLVLTNVQPWDATDYRVVVTNLSGARTSAVAHLYVMSPALLTNRVVIDNFDDNKLTGWSLFLGNRLTETNQELTVSGYWPGTITYDPPQTIAAGLLYRSWSVAEGQTLEWRADLGGMSEHATAAILELVNSTTDGTYVLFKGRDFIKLNKYLIGSGPAHFLYERAMIQNTNVVIALALTRATPNLILTVRILDKTNHNAVLYERSVVDTPNADRTLTEAEQQAASGMRLKAVSDIQAPPWTSGPAVLLDVFQYNFDGQQPAAVATFDNLEVWTYKVPMIRYVDASSANPTPPYTNWFTAAANIQDAVDAALAGDEIVVTNGIYATGGRAVGTNVLMNRVAVDKPLTLRSVNGPQFTVIQGYQVPGTTNGDGAIRCVYLTNGASLSGFTLTNGATRTNGDYTLDQCGGGLRCESTSAVVSNCVLTGNSAYSDGGGASGGTLNNCKLTGNSAGDGGGGAAGGTLNNCTLTGNSASRGGGAAWGTLNNCALTGNSADSYGGGVSFGTFNNCIVYFNTAPLWANYNEVGGTMYSTVMNYCCTTPMPINGVGNITLDPQLASASHLSAISPCRGAGSGAFATRTDIDGEPWANPPSIGCDEYQAGAVTGPLSVSIVVTYTNVLAGFPVEFTALTEGRTSATVWNFADGMVTTNQPFTTHAWTSLGDYAVVLRAYNESNPGGVSATVTVHVVAQPVYYVAAHNVTPVPSYTSWATAATNIQDAVDAADAASFPPGSLLVLVTNGVYATGGRAVVGTMTNRVAVTKALTVRSVNGPQVTVIEGRQVPGTTNGDGAIRCVYLTEGASLSGFTLTNGATRSDWGSADPSHELCGGGFWCESTNAVVSNCLLVGNSADWDSGGARGGTLNNCVLSRNSAGFGGGASEATLNNCTLTGNSAEEGGGAAWGTLNDCLLTGNSASLGGGGVVGGLVIAHIFFV